MASNKPATATSCEVDEEEFEEYEEEYEEYDEEEIEGDVEGEDYEEAFEEEEEIEQNEEDEEDEKKVVEVEDYEEQFEEEEEEEEEKIEQNEEKDKNEKKVVKVQDYEEALEEEEIEQKEEEKEEGEEIEQIEEEEEEEKKVVKVQKEVEESVQVPLREEEKSANPERPPESAGNALPPPAGFPPLLQSVSDLEKLHCALSKFLSEWNSLNRSLDSITAAIDAHASSQHDARSNEQEKDERSEQEEEKDELNEQEKEKDELSEQEKKDECSKLDKKDERSEQEKKDERSEQEKKDERSGLEKKDERSEQEKKDERSEQEKKDERSEQEKKDDCSEQKEKDERSEQEKKDECSEQEEKDEHSEQEKKDELSLVEILCQKMNGKALRKYLESNLSHLARLRQVVPEALRRLPNPGKLVFDAIGKFYMQGRKAYENSRHLVSFRFASVYLLEFFVLSGRPTGDSSVKEEANLAAHVWWKRLVKENIKLATTWDSLGFILFLACFGIPKDFGSKDLGILLLECNLKIKKIDVFRRSNILVEKIPDIIKDLIRGEMYFEAAELSCCFGLTDTFPPLPLLSSFVTKVIQIGKVERQQSHFSLKSVVSCEQNAELLCPRLVWRSA